jgi:hypothetical protein
VTVDNFGRAETDRVFAGEAQLGGFGMLRHHRTPVALDQQVVPHINRDTLHSTGVFDLDAGPVTITVPDAGRRFISLIIIDEDHYVRGVYYGAGSHLLTKSDIGTRYVFAALRVLVDPDNPDDVRAVRPLQDATKVQQAKIGTFVVPNWEQASLKKVRDALIVLNSTLPDLRHAFGTKKTVDPVRHLIGTASAWGGYPDKETTYLDVTPPKNDGKTVYRLEVKEVPVNAFWSVTVYDANGYIEPNPFNAYSLNSTTARKATDGSIAIQLGGCDGTVPNCLPIMAGWNYMVRLYRPRTEVLDGQWKFPEAQPVQ